MRFRESFWTKTIPEARMILSDDPVMPTWWTTHPKESPVLIGWAAGERGLRLSGLPDEQVCKAALRALSRITRISVPELSSLLEEFHTHDWQSDPYSRGAYSYVAKGGMGAADEFAIPLEDTLFFAGEHVEDTGHSGTVHGAMMTGERAAHQLMARLL
jgi:monoamine oxidase